MTTQKKPFQIGLTGSIGMGKSTVSGFFEEEGADVWSADAAVHLLYQSGQPGFEAIRKICSDATIGETVDRGILAAAIAKSPDMLKTIEHAIHPLVATHRAAFIESSAADIIVLDIPLLFETGDPELYDMVVVVSADAETQKERVLARPNMTPEKFAMILGKQLPDDQKRALANVVIKTDVALETTRASVQKLVQRIRKDLQ